MDYNEISFQARVLSGLFLSKSKHCPPRCLGISLAAYFILFYFSFRFSQFSMFSSPRAELNTNPCYFEPFFGPQKVQSRSPINIFYIHFLISVIFFSTFNF